MLCRWLVLTAVPLLAGCGSSLDRLPTDLRSALESPDSMEVFKIEPEMNPGYRGEAIRHYPVKRKVDVPAERRGEVTAWLRDEILSEQGNSAKCFNPQDAVRVKKGPDTYIVLVCTTCGGVALFRNEKRIGSLQTRRGAKSPESTLDFLR
ncbi:hypothetical protein EON79_00220 [bacterium]|nr:MAG: hypothetical protein EON79_00220 [bacterium]